MVSFDWASKWGYLLLPAICIFGFITNLINIIIFLNSKMKDISFKYLLAISISDLLYLFSLSYLFISQCVDCPLHNTYFTHLYDFIFFHYFAPCLAIFCIFTEIILSLILYSVLKNKTYLQSLNFYLVIGFTLFVSFIYYLPLLFFKNISSINKSNNDTNKTIINYNNEYTEVDTSLGSSLYGQVLPIILQSIRIFLVIFVLTGINILNAIEFKKRYSSRSQVVLVIKESNNFNNLQTDHIVANSGISRKLSNISKIKTKQSHNITLMVLIQSALNIFGNFIIIIIIYFVICNLIFFILIYTKKTRNGTIFDFKHIKLCIRFNTSISNLL